MHDSLFPKQLLADQTSPSADTVHYHNSEIFVMIDSVTVLFGAILLLSVNTYADNIIILTIQYNTILTISLLIRLASSSCKGRM